MGDFKEFKITWNLPKFSLDQFIDVLPGNTHQLCGLGKREEILPLGCLSRLQ